MKQVPSHIVPNSKLVLVGEAPSKEEVDAGRPFAGKSGQELRIMLASVGINMDECSLLNVISECPEGNDITKFCASKKEVGSAYPYPPLSQGKYIIPEIATPNLSRLRNELAYLNPHLILALGNTACWALLGYAGITSLRGTTAGCFFNPRLKVLPTYHPAAVLRQWSLRPTVLADLGKAKREMEFREIVRPQREIWVQPTIEDLWKFWKQHLASATHVSIDIETGHGLIKCVGIGASPSAAIIIPFVDQIKEGYSYWPTPSEEKLAWNFLRQLMSTPRTFVFQNGMYDIQWLWKIMGIAPRGKSIDDTMLMHHALQPELPKGLGFMGSLYTSESSWKLLHHRAKSQRTETGKKEE